MFPMYTDLQTRVKSLDHRWCAKDSMQSYKAVLRCAMHKNVSQREVLLSSKAADISSC